MLFVQKKLFVVVVIMLIGVPVLANSHESHWATGMAIGAGSGAAVGVGLGLAFAPICEENVSQCRWQIPLFAGGVLAVVGGGVGALIGMAVPKEETFAVYPIIAPALDGGSMAGVGVGWSY